jgi:beta-fructofuranosidase
MAHAAETTQSDQIAEREKLAHDPHRPRYHYLPAANWLNDPNGLIHWKGKYHMFYQYNPNGPFHGTIHWGHTVSSDLVHWADLPIALAPTPDSPDAEGCYSGCAVDHNGVPTFIYSGHNRANPGAFELPCLATGDDELLAWTKYAENPVIAGPPEDLDVIAFRDHCVWKADDAWYQVIGSGVTGVGGTALLYRSQDLVRWEYVHPICIGDLTKTEPLWTGSMWECPDLFPLGDKHVLIVSVWDNHHTHYPIYFVGDYTAHTFTPQLPHMLDYGPSFYAPQSLRDAAGRRIMFGWLREERAAEAQRAAGWSGVMSLPRVLSIGPDGLLGVEPAPELAALRGKHAHWADIDLSPTSPDLLSDLRGDTLEIIAEFELGDDTEFGIKVRCSPDGAEQTAISYDSLRRRLAIDPQRSSGSDTAHRGVQGGQLELARDEPLRLHIFLDRSVVEVFANGRACVTSRIYPSRDDSLGVELFVQRGRARLTALDIWEMGSIWDGRG